MLGFVFGIQNFAYPVEIEIGYLVVAFPAQIDPCRAFVRVVPNADNPCFIFGFHAHSFLNVDSAEKPRLLAKFWRDAAGNAHGVASDSPPAIR